MTFKNILLIHISFNFRLLRQQQQQHMSPIAASPQRIRAQVSTHPTVPLVYDCLLLISSLNFMIHSPVNKPQLSSPQLRLLVWFSFLGCTPIHLSIIRLPSLSPSYLWRIINVWPLSPKILVHLFALVDTQHLIHSLYVRIFITVHDQIARLLARPFIHHSPQLIIVITLYYADYLQHKTSSSSANHLKKQTLCGVLMFIIAIQLCWSPFTSSSSSSPYFYFDSFPVL